MYIDYILFIIGAVLIILSLLLAVGLFLSRKRDREYRRILKDETERIDVVETLRTTQRDEETAELGQRELLSSGTVDAVPLSGYVTTELLIGESSLSGRKSVPDTFERENVIGAGLDLSPLTGKYQLLREIHGGGMSRVFLARHRKLGNEWLVKFVDNCHAALADEAEVLKKLNHISLPQIIDIFQSRQGTFLVERYIEGYSMDQVLQLDQKVKESMICDWGIQLAQALHYLHHLETPIIHCDLKPSNIMVTHDNRLMLIDFGVSRRQGISEKSVGMTYRYAAPEQFQNKPEMARRRFGTLPGASWVIDERTDLYSVGVILYELATGGSPGPNGYKDIYSKATAKMADVICKCLQFDPQQRFQSAKELEKALGEVNRHQLTMTKRLIMRRVAGACCALCLAGGLAVSGSAVYINQMETISLVSLNPSRALVTQQQSVQILVQQTRPNGEAMFLQPEKIQWSYSEDNIARLEGDRLLGLNVGETTLYGKYRNKVFTLDVTVTEPVGQAVEVALRYAEGVEVSVYAGNGERDTIDGRLGNCSFVSPECMATDGKRLCIIDSGVIRFLEDDEVSTMYLSPEYLTASQVQPLGDNLYVLTGPWEDAEDGVSYYGFLEIAGDSAAFLYYTEAAWSTITDFAFDSAGTLWFIQQNMGSGMTTLNTLDIGTQEITWVMDLPEMARNMTFNDSNDLYISVPEDGVILRVGAGETAWTYFAGVKGERHFVDGAIPNFYRPTALAADGDALYVLDFDTVRRITVQGEGALFTETLMGIPTEDTSPVVVLGSGHEAVLPASELADLTLDGDGRLLVSDPKNSVIYEVETP